MRVTELRGRLPQQEALNIYNQIKFLPLARFAACCLHLLFIARGNETLYRATYRGLEQWSSRLQTLSRCTSLRDLFPCIRGFVISEVRVVGLPGEMT
ncbi:hypothetical protein M404DRAFT_1003342 [Pisolithus tinctorius Marx 270]|uniref:Uncharacterized protein n=1 Tax=Pisolithus tinctorius Marx 270 TaxID=870435 RepID=A0A0C3NJ87_PISTI|nr:hypothetical protein M404DRAFT_1003342 [Pisolithus tinctorius Marx 270]